MTTRKVAVAILVALGMSGCATTPQYRLEAWDRDGRAPKVVLVQEQMVVNEKMLHFLFAPNVAPDAPESRQAVKNAVETAQARALDYLASALKTQAGINVITNDATARAVEKLGLNRADTVVTPDIAEQLRAVSGADAILRFRLTDYGATPKAWRKGVIVFEVTSTLAIALLAYAKPATRPLAGVYLVTETIEETAEAYGGFWALDWIYRPIRLEAELIPFDTGIPAWEDSATGFSDRSLTRLWRKVGDAERDQQLDRALHDAVNAIVTDLRKALPPGVPQPDGMALGR